VQPRSARARFAPSRPLALVLVLVSALVLGTPTAGAQLIDHSVTVRFINFSPLDVATASGLQAGNCWDQAPPGVIPAGATVVWKTEPCNPLIPTPLVGVVGLRIRGAPNGVDGQVTWDTNVLGNPNPFTATVPQGCELQRRILQGGAELEVELTLICRFSSLDGIPDLWKIHGALLQDDPGAPAQLVDLPRMGAKVGQKDIFVHMDWMEDSSRSQKVRPEALRRVRDAFLAKGFHLHIDHGPDSVNYATNQPWGNLSRAHKVPVDLELGSGSKDAMDKTTYDWTEFDAIKEATGEPISFKRSGRSRIFRYALAAVTLGKDGGGTLSAAGLARSAIGSDFLLALGVLSRPATVDDETGTFMHELGHSLGLEHGGVDEVNYKPNYFSVMNYAYADFGVPRSSGPNIWDYHSAPTTVFDERGIVEERGLGPQAAGYGASHYCKEVDFFGTLVPDVRLVTNFAAEPIDWDCDGVLNESGYDYDVNNDSPREPAGTLGVLISYDDWANLKLANGLVGQVSGALPLLPRTTTTTSDPPPQDRVQTAPPDTTPPVSTTVASPAPNAAGWHKTDVTVTLSATDNAGGSGPARLEYNLNNTGWQKSTAPVVVSTDGSHTFQYRAIDRARNQEAAKSITVKIDKTPPTVSCSANPTSIWPANHKMVNVTAAVSVTDPGSSQAGFVLVSVTSNEPDNGQGDGNTGADIQGFVVNTPDVAGQLRAERSGGGSGRVYTLTYKGSDVAGNSTTCNTSVTVAHDRGR
jgi:hypothetical protein